MAYIRASENDFNKISEMKNAFLRALGQAMPGPNDVHDILTDDNLDTNETKLQQQRKMKEAMPPRNNMVQQPMPANNEEIYNETTNLTTPVLGPKETPIISDPYNPAMKNSLGPPDAKGTIEKRLQKQIDRGNKNSNLYRTVMDGTPAVHEHNSPIKTKYKVTNNPRRKEEPPSKGPKITRKKR